MAALWHSPFLAGARRKQTIFIICSAVVLTTFIYTFLLSWSPPKPFDIHDNPTARPPSSDHNDGTAASPPGQEAANTVKASTGIYTGKLDDEYDNVREFLNVPYALPPIKDKRFMPPIAVPRSSAKYDATQYGMACPQFVSTTPSIWSEELPWYRIPHEEGERGETAWLTDEDCLSLAIWVPAGATEESKLPVAMFWPGGGFQNNGILVPAHQPAQWVSSSQSHIVVTINYRLGIFGFPNAAGAEEQNLGLMDQRMALEWVRDNIHYFGGDPGGILVWGFSAGAQSVDFHNYAHYQDPIARSYFAQSGSCLAFGSGQAEDHSKFTFVSNKFGCYYADNPAQELACMQAIPYKEIIDFIGQYDGDVRLRFGPITDERLVFSNYQERYMTGKVSKVPMIYSSAANDGASLSRYNAQNPEVGPDQEIVNVVTRRIMCGAAESARLRYNLGLNTYRYQYAGVWPNQNPLPWLGSYHSSDLPMFFGTFDNGTGEESTDAERVTSATMQRLLERFLDEPYFVSGWEPFDPTAEDGGTILRLGAKGKAIEKVAANDVESICHGEGTYDPFP